MKFSLAKKKQMGNRGRGTGTGIANKGEENRTKQQCSRVHRNSVSNQ